MLLILAQRLAQAGMHLAMQQDLASCARCLVEIARELELVDESAFIGHGELRELRAGEVDLLPAEATATAAPDASLPDEIVELDGWLGVRVADVSGTDPSWSGTLWARGDAQQRQLVRTLAQQASVAFTLVRERQRQQTSQEHQKALVEAGKSLAKHHDVDALLEHIVELATTLVGARYGALGIVDETGTTIDRFITVGLDDATRAQIGDPPKGLGILGVLIHDPRPLRLARLQDHPASVGFPPNHPPMTSFLGVPITTRDEVKGRLYLAEKLGADQFSQEDEELAISLASQAAIAIENAELYSALLTANEHKSAFLANMSHELRSPLNTIIGYTQLLLDEPGALDEEQVEDLTIVQGSGRHLLALISDLLDLSKVEAGKIELYPARVDAARLLQDSVTAVRPQLHDGVELVATVPQSRVEFTADPDRVRQMLLNVLGNAVKFTTEGQIRATLVTSGDVVRFEVADDGPGIPAEDMERLFESFYQSRAALQRTPRASEGAGLGLAITQRLAHLHDGRVELDSTFGTGTTVVIELPMSGPAAEHKVR